MIAREGLPFILVAAVVAVGLTVVGLWPIALVAAAVTLYFCWFFRDPKRTAPQGENLVLAPGDGRVVAVAERPDGRAGLSIFLGLLDVHVNRCPVGGRVAEVEHVPGRFVAAYRPDAGEINEQNRIRFETPAGDVDMRQVVGVAARRIVCWRRPGEEVAAGDRLGIMKFGSRIDLVLPVGSRVDAAPGDRVRAGESIIGRLPDGAASAASAAAGDEAADDEATDDEATDDEATP